MNGGSARRGRGWIDWGALVERLCFLFPPVIGVGVVGLLQDVDPGVPLLGRALVLVGSVGYAVLSVALAAGIWLDARERAGGDQWRPRPWANALPALVVGPFAGVVYLARRHRHFGTSPGWSGWWTIVALSLGTTLAGTGAALVGVLFAVPELVRTGVGVAGAVAVGTFPVAIHQDAAHVCTVGGRWRPNPGLYLGLAFLSLSLPPLQPLVAGYYLLRRRRDVGVP